MAGEEALGLVQPVLGEEHVAAESQVPALTPECPMANSTLSPIGAARNPRQVAAVPGRIRNELGPLGPVGFGLEVLQRGGVRGQQGPQPGAGQPEHRRGQRRAPQQVAENRDRGAEDQPDQHIPGPVRADIHPGGRHQQLRRGGEVPEGSGSQPHPGRDGAGHHRMVGREGVVGAAGDEHLRCGQHDVGPQLVHRGHHDLVEPERDQHPHRGPQCRRNLPRRPTGSRRSGRDGGRRR